MVAGTGRLDLKGMPRLLAALLAAFAVALAPASAAAAPCRDADAVAGEVGTAAMATAVLCEINNERRARKLAPLRADAALATAAAGRAEGISLAGNLGHPPTSLLARVLETTYSAPRALAELSAWRTGQRATAADAVAHWLRSRSHRSALLRGVYRDAGVSVSPSGTGAAFVVVLGARR